MSNQTVPATIALILALGAAGSAEAGIFIGNPIVIEGVTTDSSDLELAEGDLAQVEFEACGRASAWVETVDAVVDISGGGIAFDVPSAEYCKVILKYSGDLDLEGDAGGGWTHSLSDGDFVLVPNAAETAFVLELTEISAADVELRAAE